jgi:hypothetical protein
MKFLIQMKKAQQHMFQFANFAKKQRKNAAITNEPDLVSIYAERGYTTIIAYSQYFRELSTAVSVLAITPNRKVEIAGPEIITGFINLQSEYLIALANMELALKYVVGTEKCVVVIHVERIAKAIKKG